jgi:hypothetical protein
MNGLCTMNRKYEKCMDIWKDDKILADSILVLKIILKEEMRGGELVSAGWG